eukprot:symbB.v1.2.030465.t1/scaffold3403.1/size114713/2
MQVNTTRVSLKASLKRFFEDLRSKVIDTKPRELQTRQQIMVWSSAFVLKLANASMAALENNFRGQTKALAPAGLGGQTIGRFRALAHVDPTPADDSSSLTLEDRRLLQSMGWEPDEHEGGLEEWEIAEAQESRRRKAREDTRQLTRLLLNHIYTGAMVS